MTKRCSSVEPLFDLIAKVIGTSAQQKQIYWFFQCTLLFSIGVLSVQIAMMVNAVWKLPTRNVSHMAAVFQLCTPLINYGIYINIF